MKPTRFSQHVIRIALSGALLSIVYGLAQAKTMDISLAEPGDWRLDVSEEPGSERGVTLVTVRCSTAVPAVRPALRANLVRPQRDAQVLWHTDAWYGNLRPSWRDSHASDIREGLPLYTVMTTTDRNRLTLASDNCVRGMKFSCGTDERGNVRAEWTLQPSIGPLTNDIVRFRLDERDCDWSDSVRQAARWSQTFQPAAAVPRAAYRPVYSTWYAHHTDLNAATVLDEARQAKSLGFASVFIDAGWYMDAPGSFGKPAGDWVPSAKRFPNLGETVRQIHALGLKCVLWYAPPLVGRDTQAAKRFSGKSVGQNREGTKFLDPRFPEIREHLISTLEQAVRDWDVDGFKIDYLYAWGKPEIAESMLELARSLHSRLRAIKPDILLEFTHGQHNAAMRSCCTMHRVGDCAGDIHENRSALARLRLTNGDTACHSDMITWGPDDTPEDAARQILSALFGTMQCSVDLRTLSPAQRRTLAHWINFMTLHENALLHGEFRPHHPEANYPLIESADDREHIAAVYTAGQVVGIPRDSRSHFVVNATGAANLIVECPLPANGTIFDTQGDKVKAVVLTTGLQSIPVPAGGYVCFTFNKQSGNQ